MISFYYQVQACRLSSISRTSTALCNTETKYFRQQQSINRDIQSSCTRICDGVWMNFVKWQRKLIRVLLEQSHLTKSSMRFVVDRILQIINRAPNGPNPNNYKCESVRELGVPFIEGEKAKEIIDTFVEWMAPIPNKPMKKSQIDWLGIANQTHIESNLSKFLYTGLKIVSKLEEIRDGMGDEQKNHSSANVQDSMCHIRSRTNT